MDYLSKIDTIIAVLIANKESHYSDRIIFLKESASVSSELLMSVTYELSLIVAHDQKMRKLIGSDVRELREYCYSIGLHVR